MILESNLQREARQREEKFILQKEKIEALKNLKDKGQISKTKLLFKQAEEQMNQRHLAESAPDLTISN